MPVITLTTTAADAARVQATSIALGFANVDAFIVSLVTNAVSSHEQQASQVAFADGYVPIAPAGS
jgi:hypothetical protein